LEDAISQQVTIDPFNTQINNITITFSLTDVNNELPIPDNIVLHQNFPNPFNSSTNSSTTISFLLARSDFVELRIMSILGETIAVLINDNLTSGNYDIQFDASNLASGIYFYRLQAGDFVETRKMALIK